MKIKGPGDSPPVAPAAGPEGADALREPEGVYADATAPVAGTGGPAEAAPADPVRALAEDLRAGRITPDQAIERMVDDAVDRVGVPEAVRADLREEILRVARADPVLSARLARVAGSGSE